MAEIAAANGAFHLVVEEPDIEAARAELAPNGIDVSKHLSRTRRAGDPPHPPLLGYGTSSPVGQ